MNRPQRHASAQDGQKTGDRTGVGFFIPLPPELGEQFPDLGEDDHSPAHTTFLYVGDVPADREDEFLSVSLGALALLREPVRAVLADQKEFVNPAEARKVAVQGVRFSRDLSDIRWRLREALLNAGFEVQDSFPLVYQPHVTLQYLDGLDARYEGPVIEGSWTFDEIEIWGLPEMHSIPFGQVIPYDSRMQGGRRAGLVQLADAGRQAKSFELNVGDPVLHGKFLNKPGVIRGFSKNEKGDPTVTIEPLKGGQEKEVKLFKVRYDEARAGKEAALDLGVGPSRWTKRANPQLALEYRTKLDKLAEQVKYNEARQLGDTTDLWLAFSYFYRAGRAWGQYLIDKLAIPAGRAKAVEMAVRLFSKTYGSGKSPVGGILNWWHKNERHLRTLEETLTWQERSADSGIFKHGPFTVHNTVGADDKALDEAKAIIDRAVRLLSQTGVAGLPQMAYGDLYLVGQIGRKNWAAWYMPDKDSIYLRPKMRGIPVMQAALHLVHELGHRFWRKKLSSVVRTYWIQHHDRMVNAPVKYSTPDVGTVLPMLVNNKKVRVDSYLPGQAVLVNSETGDPVGRVPTLTLVQWMANTEKKLKFPTLYAATDAEEHFCESLAHKGAGDLSPDNEAAFDRIVLGVSTEAAVRLARRWLERLAVCSEEKDALAGHTPSYLRLMPDYGQVNASENSVDRVAAKYQKKKQVPKADGKGTTTVYEYSERQIATRNREKAERVEKLRGNLGKLRDRVKKDLKSDDPKTRLSALAVGLINDTYERVGNDESAKDGHVGVTGWAPEHVKFGDGKATFTYVGKSGVDQKKETKDADLIRVLKEAVKDKAKGDTLFTYDGGKVDAAAVNEYLEGLDLGITAKDIRGLHANREMQTRLKAIRSKGGKLPTEKKDREKQLKDEFKEALEGTAEAVGHEASTLRSQYLVPGLEDDFMKDGTVTEKMDKKGSLAAELDRRMAQLLRDYETALEQDASWPQMLAIGEAFAKWFTSVFRVAVSTTPKGGLALKKLVEKFLWSVKHSVPQQRSTGGIRYDWGLLQPQVPDLVAKFSDEGGTEVLRELTTSVATYLNLRGVGTPLFKKYVQSLDAIFGALHGWRRKALTGNFKVALAGPDQFRGTAKGRYRAEEDTLFVRATPEVMRRSEGYASAEYILVHEVGHRYEKKVGVQADFDRVEWHTTPYSRTEGLAGFSESFAELFALGHFGITSYRDLQFGDRLAKFEQVMGGGSGRTASLDRVITRMMVRQAAARVGTKTDAEKSDEEAERLVRPMPTKKPPRKDLRRERVQVDDPDTKPQGAENDKDLSLNYKKVGRSPEEGAIRRVALRYLMGQDAPAPSAPPKPPTPEKPKGPPKGPGKHWQAETGTWMAWPPGGDGPIPAPKGEEQAKAIAKGQEKSKKRKGPEGEDRAQVEEIQREERIKKKRLERLEKGEETPEGEAGDQDKADVAEAEAVQKHEQTKTEEQAKAEAKARVKAEAAVQRTKTRLTKVTEGLSDKSQETLAKVLPPEPEAADPADDPQTAKAKVEKAAQHAQAWEVAGASYNAELKRLNGLAGQHGHSNDDLKAAGKELSKPAELKGKTPEEIGAALAKRNFLLNNVLNPSKIGGKPLSPADQTPEALTERTKASFEAMRSLPKKARTHMAQKAADQLQKLDPASNEAKELNRVIDGMQMAALAAGHDFDATVTDADGNTKLLRDPLPERASVLLQHMMKNGDVDVLLGGAEDFTGPKGREALTRGVKSMDTGTLVKASEGQPWSAMAEAIDDPLMPEATRTWVKGLVSSMMVDQFTSMHGLSMAGAKLMSDEGPTTSKALREAAQGLSREANAKLEQEGSGLLDLLRDAAQGDPKALQAKGDQLRVSWFKRQYEKVKKTVERAGKKLNPTDRAVAIGRHIGETGDLSVQDAKLVSKA